MAPRPNPRAKHSTQSNATALASGVRGRSTRRILPLLPVRALWPGTSSRVTPRPARWSPTSSGLGGGAVGPLRGGHVVHSVGLVHDSVPDERVVLPEREALGKERGVRLRGRAVGLRWRAPAHIGSPHLDESLRRASQEDAEGAAGTRLPAPDEARTPACPSRPARVDHVVARARPHAGGLPDHPSQVQQEVQVPTGGSRRRQASAQPDQACAGPGVCDEVILIPAGPQGLPRGQHPQQTPPCPPSAKHLSREAGRPAKPRPEP